MPEFGDLCFSRVFAEQLIVHGRPGDVLICISCSGKSANLIAAIDEAHRDGLRVIAIGGCDGGELQERSDVYIHVPSYDYAVIESAHLLIAHAIATALNQASCEVAAAAP